jgi:hypothetical protein
MKCEKCEVEHDGSYGSGRFCTQKCANSNVRSSESKLKSSLAAKASKNVKIATDKKKGVKLVDRILMICEDCKKEFEIPRHKKYQKYCGHECRKKHLGGFRENGGKSKNGYYKGIYCGSTYELVWVIYQLDHNKDFSRFENAITYNNEKYIPDFLQDNIIIEIKGFLSKNAEKQLRVAKGCGYEIKMLFKEDLTTEFDWVKSNYSFMKVQELYDNHIPEFEYECAYCAHTFRTNNKRVNKKIFCNRICAGKFYKLKK